MPSCTSLDAAVTDILLWGRAVSGAVGGGPTEDLCHNKTCKQDESTERAHANPHIIVLPRTLNSISPALVLAEYFLPTG